MKHIEIHENDTERSNKSLQQGYTSTLEVDTVQVHHVHVYQIINDIPI